MRTHTKETQQGLTPQTALDVLREGNERFLANLKFNRNLLEQVNTTAEEQFPFAVVLSCIDSRTSAELIFDQGLGDIFSVRIAGNILNEDILGSMEYACKLAGSKLIVVMGHSTCGAVKGACSGAELGHLSGLLGKIKPAIELAGERGTDAADFVQRVAEVNVDLVVREIQEQSPVLDELIRSGEVGLVGALYSVQSGEITFHDLLCGEADAS